MAAEVQGTVNARWLRWVIVLGAGALVMIAPVPAGVTPESWRVLAIFVATMVGLVAQPVPGGAVVLFGVCALAISLAVERQPPTKAFAGYGEPVVWLVLCAFMISRAMIKTGLGRRIALYFVRLIGQTSLGLGYALAAADGVLASIIPSNGARGGGIIFPIAKSLAETYDSKPGPSARRLGSFLMVLLYNTDVIVCAIFFTGQASNAIIAGFARQATGLDLNYPTWLMGSIVPGLVSLLIVPFVFYRLYPPEVKHTPGATELARRELDAQGPVSPHEKLMLGVFALVMILWITTRFHRMDAAVPALIGVCILLLCNVLDWNDVITEKGAWDVFIWYGGLVQMAKLLGESGITKVFANWTAGWIAGWQWGAALAVILLVYFFAHYGFASITAHATAMFIPFLTVTVAAGAPPWVAVLSLAYFSNLCAALTHYGTTPGPIFFGAGYVPQTTWWRMGLVASMINIPIWGLIGMVWWKILGLW
jgi:divalent anion:Na+ symporter, DASS family